MRRRQASKTSTSLHSSVFFSAHLPFAILAAFILTLMNATHAYGGFSGSNPTSPRPDPIGAPVIPAPTQRDQLVSDADHDGLADPGDTLRFTVTITNSGNTAATGVQFSEDLSTALTLVPGSLNSSPLAMNDAYTFIGNTPIDINAANGLLANDFDLDGDALSILSFDSTSAQGGQVNLSADGSFQYNPPLGFTGDDTFTYTIQDTHGEQDQARVTLTAAQLVWYIDNSANTGNGSYDQPFNSLSDYNSARSSGGPSAPKAGDFIFIYTGNGPYSGGITLLNNQSLIGQGDSLQSGGVSPVPGANLPAAGGAPTLTNAGVVISLAQNNRVQGLIVGNAGGSGKGMAGANFGSLTLKDLSINTDGAGLDLNTGSLDAAISSIGASAGNSYGLNLQNLSGSLTVSGTTTINGSNYAALHITNSASAAFNFSGGVSASISNAQAFLAANGGSISISGGSLSGNDAAAVDISNSDLNVSLTNVSSSGGNDGIRLVNTTGSFSVNGDGTTAGSGGTIQNKSADGVWLSSADGVTLKFINLTNTASSDGSICSGTQNSGCHAAVNAQSSANLVLDHIQIDGSGQEGINAYNVSGLTLSNSSVQNAGNQVNEHGLYWRNVTGSVAITGSTIGNSAERNALVENSNDTTVLNVTGSTFQNNSATLGADGLEVLARGNSEVTLTIVSSQFANNQTNGVQAYAIDQAKLHFSMTTSLIQNNGVGVDMGADNTASMDFNLDSNQPFSGQATTSINLFTDGSAHASGKISNNTISGPGTSQSGIGIRLDAESDSQINALVQNNTISNIGWDDGIQALARSGSGRLDLHIDGNQVTMADTNGAYNFEMRVQDSNTLCADVTNNWAYSEGLAGFRLRQADPTATFILPGYSGNVTTTLSTNGNHGSVSESGTFQSGACNAIALAAPATPLRYSKIALAALEQPARNAVKTPASAALVSAAAEPDNAQASTGKVFASLSPVKPTAPAAPLTLGPFDLPAGKSLRITFDASVDNPVPAGYQQLSNQGQFSGTNISTLLTDDPDTPQANDATLTPLDAGPDLQATISDGGISAVPGDLIDYTLVYSNAGNQDASGVQLQIAVPADTSFAAASSSAGWSCTPDASSGSACTLDIGNLAAGSSGNANFAVQVANPLSGGVTQINTSATIQDDSSGGSDRNPGDNSTSDNTPVNAQPDLQLKKSDGGSYARPGDLLAYTLEYTNAGNQDASGVTLFEAVPDNTTFNAAQSSAGWACTPDDKSGSACSLSIGNLAGGGAQSSVTFSVDISNTLPYGTANIHNSASTSDDGSNGSDPTPGNNSASLDTPVDVPPSLASLTLTPAVSEGSAASLDLAIGDPGPPETHTVQVDWGDGITQTYALAVGELTLNVQHTYLDDNPSGTSQDDYTVQVDVSEADLDQVHGSGKVTVHNVAPSITNLSATDVNENSSTTLSGRIQDPGILDSFSLNVDWGDGITDTYSLPAGTLAFTETHQYLDDNPTGSAQDAVHIAVTLQDDDTGSANASTTITVHNVAPTLSNVSLTPAVDEGGTATLSGKIQDPGTLDTFNLTIDWGDGSPDNYSLPAGTLTFTETHQYLDDNPTGTAQDVIGVKVSVQDDDSGSTSASPTITVRNVAPTLSNLSLTSAVDEGGTATLSGQIQDPGVLDSFNLTVDWGDGSTDTYSLPAGTTAFTQTHQYLDDKPSGTAQNHIDVQVTLKDDDTGSASASLNITVSNVAPIFAQLNLPATVNEGQPATLNGILHDPGTLDTFQLRIGWGDGLTQTLSLPAGTTAFTAKHIYLEDSQSHPGGYGVHLLLADDDGGQASADLKIQVANLPPVFQNVRVTSPVSEGSQATLTGKAVDPGALDPVNLHLDWGDGVTTTLSLPAGTSAFSSTHTFLDDNPSGTPWDIISIQIQASDDDGGTTHTQTSVRVENVAPLVAVHGDQVADVGQVLHFAGSYSDPGLLDSHQIRWDFGDGSIISGTLTPTHTYQSDGKFTVKLQVSDDDGGIGKASLDVNIGRHLLYLPIVRKSGLSDLVASLQLSPDRLQFVTGEPVTITVTITNQGSEPASGFWVDLYINPSQPPDGPNHPWDETCGFNPCYGMAWFVDQSLAPEEAIQLTSTPASFLKDYSIWPGSFPAGVTDLYVYADSWDPGVNSGAVIESDESNNRAELHGLQVLAGTNPSTHSAPQPSLIYPRPPYREP
jgi:uncharacterized repeat protein (TIGR01451 family)